MYVEYLTSNIDGFVKSHESSFSVIPAQAGIQYFQVVLDACLRRHDGITVYYELVNIEHQVTELCSFIKD